MKSNVLSAGIGSVPALTTPCTDGSLSVNGENESDADAFGPTLTGSVSITWPSISSETGRLLSGVAPLLAIPAVTVIRSWLENDERAKVTDGTATFETVSVATDTGVSVMPSEKCASSEPDQ